MSAQCEPESSVVPWDGISLGVGRTRRFLKMTHQPPKLLCTSDGSSVNQSLPPQARQTGLFGLAPPPAPVLLLLCTSCLSLVPPPVWYGVEGRALFFSPTVLLAFCSLSVRPSLCHHPGLETPQHSDFLFYCNSLALSPIPDSCCPSCLGWDRARGPAVMSSVLSSLWLPEFVASLYLQLPQDSHSCALVPAPPSPACSDPLVPSRTCAPMLK